MYETQNTLTPFSPTNKLQSQVQITNKSRGMSKRSQDPKVIFYS